MFGPRHGCSSETRCWWAAVRGRSLNQYGEAAPTSCVTATSSRGLRYSPVPLAKARGKTGKSAPAKECVTTHKPNPPAPKMDDASAQLVISPLFL
jgi:hypothetical protein